MFEEVELVLLEEWVSFGDLCKGGVSYYWLLNVVSVLVQECGEVLWQMCKDY